jgi:hypothetical protein
VQSLGVGQSYKNSQPHIAAGCCLFVGTIDELEANHGSSEEAVKSQDVCVVEAQQL